MQLDESVCLYIKTACRVSCFRLLKLEQCCCIVSRYSAASAVVFCLPPAYARAVFNVLSLLYNARDDWVLSGGWNRHEFPSCWNLNGSFHRAGLCRERSSFSGYLNYNWLLYHHVVCYLSVFGCLFLTAVSKVLVQNMNKLCMYHHGAWLRFPLLRNKWARPWVLYSGVWRGTPKPLTSIGSGGLQLENFLMWRSNFTFLVCISGAGSPG